MSIAAGTGGTDVGFAATVAVRADGSLNKTLRTFDNTSSTTVGCNVRAKWRVGKGFVSLTVPHSCIPLAGRGPVYLSARTVSYINDNEADYAPPALHLALN